MRVQHRLRITDNDSIVSYIARSCKQKSAWWCSTSGHIDTGSAFPKSLGANGILEGMRRATSLANSRASPSADVDLVGCWPCGGLDSDAILLNTREEGQTECATQVPLYGLIKVFIEKCVDSAMCFGSDLSA